MAHSQPVELTSAANPRVKDLLNLRRRRVREQRQVTLVEGYEELTLALDAGVIPQTLYFCPFWSTGAETENTVDRALALGSEVVQLSKEVFTKVAYRESPDGWLAVVPAVPTELARLHVSETSLFLVGEAVEKPGNLGAMLRTADAVGVDAVISSEPVTDWGNPNVIRASKGTIFSVPVAAAPSVEVMRWLKANSVSIVATTPDTPLAYTEVDLTGPTAVVVGSEKYGLTQSWLAEADARVHVPMQGKVNSLNVATSAAIVLYEAFRQRSVGRVS